MEHGQSIQHKQALLFTYQRHQRHGIKLAKLDRQRDQNSHTAITQGKSL